MPTTEPRCSDLPAMFDEFEQSCEIDTAALLADEEEWRRRPGRGQLRPEFGTPKPRRRAQRPLFDDLPMFGGSNGGPMR